MTTHEKMTNSNPGRFKNFTWLDALYLIFWGSLTVLLLLYALRPICDPDFWWHLKTGDVILQQKGLLKIDPFNYTGDVIVRGREAVILNGYWLWQITASFLYATCGLNGIFFLKFVTVVLIAWAVHYEMSRQSVSPVTRAILSVLGTVVLIKIYNLERPQVFSIFFITLLLGMIARIRMGHPPSWLLFPLMIIWANIHGGFVVGDILLFLTAAGFMIQYRCDRPTQLRLLLWAFAGIIASFINPNGWDAFIETFNFMQNTLGLYVDEFHNSWYVFFNRSKLVAALWLVGIINLIGLLLIPRRFWPEIFISLFLVAFGFKYMRNAGFVAVSLLPMTGWYMEQLYTKYNRNFNQYLQAGICIILSVCISLLIMGELKERKNTNGPITASFPIGMASFLKNSALSGNLFNEYVTGGYLDWALYPEWKTFIDGRALDIRVFEHYQKISSGSMELIEGRRRYELLLERYRIDVIALKIPLPSGRLQPLLKHLLNNPQWEPVYIDAYTFVLARRTEANRASIERYKYDKKYFLETMIETIALQMKTYPNVLPLSVLYTELLIYGGKDREAGEMLKKIELIHPGADILIYLKRQYEAVTK